MTEYDLSYELYNQVIDCVNERDSDKFANILNDLVKKRDAPSEDEFTRRGQKIRYQIVINQIGTRLAQKSASAGNLFDMVLQYGADPGECLNNNFWELPEWSARKLMRHITSKEEWPVSNWFKYSHLLRFYSWQTYILRPIFNDPQIFRIVLEYIK